MQQAPSPLLLLLLPLLLLPMSWYLIPALLLLLLGVNMVFKALLVRQVGACLPPARPLVPAPPSPQLLVLPKLMLVMPLHLV